MGYMNPRLELNETVGVSKMEGGVLQWRLAARLDVNSCEFGRVWPLKIPWQMSCCLATVSPEQRGEGNRAWS